MLVLRFVVLALVVAVGACRGAESPRRDRASARPSVSGTGGAAGAADPAHPAGRGTPLAVVAHPTRSPLDLDRAVAADLLRGRVDDWEDLGEPSRPLRLVLGPNAEPPASGPPTPGKGPSHLTIVRRDDEAIRAVERDFDAVAVVAATAVGPSVRALSVDGRHPIREPGAYPLTVEGPPPGRVLTALAVGDIMLSRRVYRKMLDLGDFTAPFLATFGRLAAADLTFGNYEGTMSCEGGSGQGHHTFAAVPEALEGLTLAGFDVLSLANNHAGDYGPKALAETVRLIEAAGIRTVGAGPNAGRAGSPAIVERRGVRFGFLAFNGAGETPRAGPGTPGTVNLRMRPLSPLSRADLGALLARVRALRPLVDVVIVYAHWGDEYTANQNRDQRRVAHALVEAGADLVAGSHPHWVQGAEIYRGRLIAYSLGNFVFDQSWSRETREGVALELIFWDAELKAAEFLPVAIEESHRPRILSPEEGRPVLEQLWAASEEPFRLGRARPTARGTPPPPRRPPETPCDASSLAR